MKNNITFFFIASILLVTANLKAARWVYVPARPNELKKGDGLYEVLWY